MKKIALAAFVLIVILLVGAFALRGSLKTASGSTIIPQDAASTLGITESTGAPTPSMSPYDAVEKFYESYTECMSNPPVTAFGRVSDYCRNNSGYTSPDLDQHMKSGNVDTVTCTEALPIKVTADRAVPFDDSASTVYAMAHFPGNDIRISVKFIRIDGDWAITDITCPS